MVSEVTLRKNSKLTLLRVEKVAVQKETHCTILNRDF